MGLPATLLLVAAVLGVGVAQIDIPVYSSLPPNCHEGSYRNGDEHVARWVPGCPGFSACEPGFWCDSVSKYPCPAGRYGATFGLRSEACSGAPHAARCCC